MIANVLGIHKGQQLESHPARTNLGCTHHLEVVSVPCWPELNHIYGTMQQVRGDTHGCITTTRLCAAPATAAKATSNGGLGCTLYTQMPTDTMLVY